MPRRVIFFLLLVGGVLLLTGCGTPDPPPVDSGTPAPASPALQPTDATDAPQEAACGPVEEPPLQQGSHLIGDSEPPAPYSSTPPTSGWHSSGAFEIAIHDDDDPLSEPRQVSVLEADAVVITHRDLPPEQRAALEDLVRSELDGRAAVTPYERLEPGQVALTAWGLLQVCDGVDLDAVRAFVEAHAAQDPHTPGAHG